MYFGGQGSIEYLLIISAAIIVVAIVIVAIFATVQYGEENLDRVNDDVLSGLKDQILNGELFCGNETCDLGETFENCPSDCDEGELPETYEICFDTDSGTIDEQSFVPGMVIYTIDTCPPNGCNVTENPPDACLPTNFDILQEQTCDGMTLKTVEVYCENGCNTIENPEGNIGDGCQ